MNRFGLNNYWIREYLCVPHVKVYTFRIHIKKMDVIFGIIFQDIDYKNIYILR